MLQHFKEHKEGKTHHLRIVGGEGSGVVVLPHGGHEEGAAGEACEGVGQVAPHAAVTLPDVTLVSPSRELVAGQKAFG